MVIRRQKEAAERLVNWGWRDLYGLSVVEICGWLSAGKTLSYLDKACLLCLINSEKKEFTALWA